MYMYIYIYMYIYTYDTCAWTPNKVFMHLTTLIDRLSQTCCMRSFCPNVVIPYRNPQ